MKAIQIREFNAPYKVSEIPKPQIKPHQVLLKIGAGGFCHTDLMALNNEFDTTLPYIGSHEPAGTIEEIGSEVKGFKVGQRVGSLNFDSPCGKCPDCIAGRRLYCDGPPKMKGITADGAWAEHMTADPSFLIPLPDSVSFETAACLMCAGLTIYGAIVKAGVPRGGSIGILGLGGLGHIGTQLAKVMGYTVLAVDAKQEAVDLTNSAKHKPNVTMLASDDVGSILEKVAKIDKDKYGYKGVDATILATDHPESFKLAAKLTKKHGKMVLVGQPAHGITMSFYDVIFKDITLVGSLLGDVGQGKELMKLVDEEGITVHIKKWKIEQAEEMRQEYLSGKSKGKNVIVFE